MNHLRHAITILAYSELTTWEEILNEAVMTAVATVEAGVGNTATDQEKLLILEETKNEFIKIEGDNLETLIADLNNPGSAYGGSTKDYIYDICYNQANWFAHELLDTH